MPRKIKLTALLAALLLATAAPARDHWVATWTASPSPAPPSLEEMRKAQFAFQNQTLREIVHVSIGGKSVRVRLSNAYGKEQVEIGAARIALRSRQSEVGASRALTFSGRASVIIPPDAQVLSDPVALDVPASGDLAISLFLPKHNSGGRHPLRRATDLLCWRR